MAQTIPGLAAMLDLSTVHMPESKPDFGNLRVAEHEFGYFVFMTGALDVEEIADMPEWIQPVMRLALEHNCIGINFDSDACEVPGLRTWEW